MVDEYVSKDGKLRLLRGDLALVRLEGSAKAPEGGGGVELADFPFYLLRDELPLEICEEKSCQLRNLSEARRCSQCSCFPVKLWPGGGAPPMLAVRTGRSKVELGAAAPPSSALPASSAAMSRAKQAVIWCEKKKAPGDDGEYELLRSAIGRGLKGGGWLGREVRRSSR